MIDKIEIRYGQGRATVSLPATMKIPGRQRKRIPVVLELTEEQGNALQLALSYNAMWRGDGYTHFPWPVAPEKKQKKKQNA